MPKVKRGCGYCGIAGHTKRSCSSMRLGFPVTAMINSGPPTFKGLLSKLHKDAPFVLSSFDTTKYSLSQSQLSDKDVDEFVSLIKHNTSITKINLIDMKTPRITMDGWERLMEAIVTHPTMTHVGLEDGAMDVPDSSDVLAGVFQRTIGTGSFRITRLELAKNTNMHEFGVAVVLQSLKLNQAVEYLDLTDCIIDCSDQYGLGEAFRLFLQTNKVLKHLNVNGNDLGSEVGVQFALGLRSNTSLQTLKYCWNRLNDEGAVAFGEALCHNTTLEVLDLSRNDIGDAGAIAIARALWSGSLSVLKELSLDCNEIKTGGLQAVRMALKYNRYLQELSICHNSNCSLQDIIPCVESLHYNTTLRTLNAIQRGYSTIEPAILDMLDSNDTISSIWEGEESYNIRDILFKNRWDKRTAPKKGYKQRSDTYQWLYRTLTKPEPTAKIA